jgi:hypothetical protein
MGKFSRQRRQEEIQRASRVYFESEAGQASAPQINGTLRNFALRVPSKISECSGIVVFGKRIRSLVFSTDVATIRNVNADAVLAVYPYTPQQIIAEALIHAADIPVFAGVGGRTDDRAARGKSGNVRRDAGRSRCRGERADQQPCFAGAAPGNRHSGRPDGCEQ